MKSLLLSLLILQLLLPGVNGQDWVVPADKKGKLSTFPFDETTRKAGEKLYTINCMSCHGTPGKANYLKLVPPPGDPATEKIQKNTDGEIFFKVSQGRGQMPSFKSVLSTDEIWNIVSYLRSYNNSYKQQVMAVITSSAYPGAEIRITLAYNSDSTIILHASAVKENSSVPVEGAPVKLFVHRTFGLLPIDEEKVTGKDGIAVFRVPDGLPGDTAGNLLVRARFTNEEVYGSVIKDTVLKAGIITIPVSLVAERAMWNNVRKAPVWIILTYGLGLLAAWGFIFFVLMKLRDIFIIGESIEGEMPEKDS
jgi:mono/diheme cytochrome c family protein